MDAQARNWGFKKAKKAGSNGRSCKGEASADTSGRKQKFEEKPRGHNGVDDGARTHDNRNHNPGLYQLSYIHHRIITTGSTGAPDRNRTCNPRLRRPVLYPVELRVHSVRLGSVVGAVGFELTTTWSQTRCATRLRYAPTAER